MLPALSRQIILCLHIIPLVDEMEGIRIVNFLYGNGTEAGTHYHTVLTFLFPWMHPSTTFGDWKIERVGMDKIDISPNCIVVVQRFTSTLPCYSFMRVLLWSLLLLYYYSVCSNSILLYCLRYIHSLLVMSNQCHNVTHISRIHGDKPSLPHEFLDHGIIEVDPLLKGCSAALMLCL